MMLAELLELLKFTDPSSGAPDYRAAITEDNLLGKRTVATRKLTFQRMAELYGLDPAIPIFRVMRKLWDSDRVGRPMLAFLVAYSRDPLLRMTADLVLATPLGRSLTTADLDHALEGRLGQRLNASVRNKVARNIGSSWTQSGHLTGRGSKRRDKPVLSPAVVCLALLIGYCTGLRGRAMLGSEWVRLLSLSHADLMEHVRAAHRLGLLDFHQVGDTLEIQFPALLRPFEQALCHG